MGQITIYPNANLEEVINKEAKKQKRSVNNFLIYLLEQTLKKQLNEKSKRGSYSTTRGNK